MFRQYVLIFIIVFAVFFPCLKAEFINLDDPAHLTSNPVLEHFDLNSIRLIFSQIINTLYQPLTILSFAIEKYFFGSGPFIYHLDNVLLHIAVTILVFTFALKMGLSKQAAFIAALIFGIHPIKVESVAWVTERKDVLFAFFYLLSMHFYWNYLDKKKPGAYLLSVLFGIASMLSKPMALSLPLVLFLLDWYKGRGNDKNTLLEKLPFLSYTLLIGWASFCLNIHRSGVDVPQALFHIKESVLIWIWCFDFYIWKFLCPINVYTFYQLPTPIEITHWPYAASVILFLFLVFAVFKLRKDRCFMFAVIFYFLTIFFLLRLNKGDYSLVSDRFMYLPSLGICLLLGKVFERSLRSRFAVLLMLCIFIWLGVKTFYQCMTWRDSFTYAREFSSHYPDLSTPYLIRAAEYINMGKKELAIEELSRAINNGNSNADLFLRRGLLYYGMGDYVKAFGDIDRIVYLHPKNALAYWWRGQIKWERKDHMSAVKDFQKASELKMNFSKDFLDHVKKDLIINRE